MLAGTAAQIGHGTKSFCLAVRSLFFMELPYQALRLGNVPFWALLPFKRAKIHPQHTCAIVLSRKVAWSSCRSSFRNSPGFGVPALETTSPISRSEEH